MSPVTVSLIVPQVCDTIWDAMVDEQMPPPTEADWREIESGFKNRWNFPNCCGALDGKHIALRHLLVQAVFFLIISTTFL